MIASTTEGEFLRFSEKFRHKKAAEILRTFHEWRDSRHLDLYRRVEGWCGLPRLSEEDFPALSDRYHMHLAKAEISWKEHNLLATTPFHQQDEPSSVPCLPIAIYLDNLRSAFNVGSILRTTEAFRLGKVCFAKQTPFVDNLKVQKTSMDTFDKVVCEQNAVLSSLPRPMIALETDPNAPCVFDFVFPPSFTLMLGNEEYGLSKESLAQADAIVRIPLVGYKNSLNVASAFAIAAGVISNQLRKN
ncbi:MAG: TrmH family RNA methyltransferase [Verrucomicrobia bacterium]|nr:TrmH family RNA methyltransferase [Verrucomicrobiota bacterium]